MIRQFLPAIWSVVVLCLFCEPPAVACTLWAAAGGRVKDGGTLISKNRDQKPDQKTFFEIIHPPKGFAYLSMSGGDEDGTTPRGGINERGFAVVAATAGSVQRKVRLSGEKGAVRHLLQNFQDVEAALSDKARLKRFHPVFLLLADKGRVAAVEISTSGVSVKVSSSGVLAHTNHYIVAEDIRQKPSASSVARLARIRELVAAAPGMTLEDAIVFGNDNRDGPDNGILRTGGTKGAARTLGRISIRIPPDAAPEVSISLENTGRKAKPEKRLTLDENFWSGSGVILE